MMAKVKQLILSCRLDNGLFRVLGENRVPVERYPSPAEAVGAAVEGDGVMVLADGYPGTATPMEESIYDAAARKKLKLYVEFPSFLPGVPLGEVAYLRTGEYGAIIERTVVASDAFGEALPRLRIMMIHDCHYLPAEAESPHLVLGRVEGYDTAVYGVPSPAAQILFEHQRGDLLVATTKLSQFVTARYAPYEAWPHVWKMILGWTLPGGEAPFMSWTPTVRPRHSRAAALPADETVATIRRGVDYYGRSRLFIHPDWPESTGVEPISPEWPEGDGSHGIGECYISKRTFFDGSQAVSRSARTDCNLEAALGLACGSVLFEEESYAETAKTLNDLIMLESTICRDNGRSDPESPVYGLLSYHTGDVEGGYWADDNARALLGAIGSRSTRSMNPCAWK